MKAIAFALALAASLPACSAAPESTSSTDDALSSKKPIPYVLQYAGDYEGSGGHVDYLLLKRDGHWTGSIDGRTKSGVYFGPNAPSSAPPKIAFVTQGLEFTADVGPWAPYQTLVVHYAGHIETLTAPWPNGSENICDASAGTWTDDDADPATGLFCICPTHKSYIPSLGGCVR